MSKFPKPARRRHPRFATEALEARCLLSAFVSEFPLPSPTTGDAVSSAVDARARDQSAERSVSDGVQVLELDSANNDSDAGHKIGVIELPEAVVLAVNSRLPGATIEAAETDVENGAPLFEVHVEFHGINLDVVFSPDGEVLAIKQPLAATALPHSLRNWMASNFSRASDFEAERVVANDLVSYELWIATPKRRTFDAMLRLADGHSPRLLPTSDAIIGRDAEQPYAAEQVTTRTSSARAISLASVSPKGPQTAQYDNLPANNAADKRSRDAAAINAAEDQKHSDHTIATRLAAVSDTSGTAAQVTSFSLTNATSATRLSLMARVLTDVLPQDLATIERGLREFLNGVNSLTDMTGEDSATRGWLPTLLTAAAALYGAAQFISERRKSTQDSDLGAAGQSSWTWVLNLSTSSDSQALSDSQEE